MRSSFTGRGRLAMAESSQTRAIASKNWRAVERTGVSLAKKNLCESVKSVDFLVFFSLCEQQVGGCFSWIQVRRFHRFTQIKESALGAGFLGSCDSQEELVLDAFALQAKRIGKRQRGIRKQAGRICPRSGRAERRWGAARYQRNSTGRAGDAQWPRMLSISFFRAGFCFTAFSMSALPSVLRFMQKAATPAFQFRWAN